jgi:ribitol-5-phosphate 2-dehydrogenase (NADP+) / D-ribitol-5-phosphate cytidylyltransferase
MQNHTAAILLAGGLGSRMGGEQPKQFIRIAGKPVLVHSYEALRKQMPEAMIVIVAPVDAMAQVCSLLAHESNSMIVPGGASRQASTLEGLKALLPFEPTNVLIHDAARPFVSGQIIQDVLKALLRHEAVDVAIPATDTIVVERDGYIQSIPDRKHILRGQTPQAFRYQTLLSCYEEVGEDRLSNYTDDCGIYLHCNPMGKVRIVWGHEENFKITTPVDMILADEMFRLRQAEINIEQPGVDVRGKKVLIFGGTAGIGKAMADIMRDAGAQLICRGRSNGCDVRTPEAVRLAVDQAVLELEGLDVVVNAVGQLKKGRIDDQSDLDIADQVAINLSGALWIAKYSHAALKASRGALLQFASSSYTRGRADYVTYSATKAAIVNMTQGLSEEWEKDGIRVNCVVPGRTDTGMRRDNFDNEPQNSLFNPYQIAINAVKLVSTRTTGMIQRGFS